MKIAFTGSSSTGKTTLSLRLHKDARFRDIIPNLLAVDARSLLESNKFKSMDKMTREEQRGFQRLYLQRKIDLEEKKNYYITDRSFIDVAAYWLERDSEGLAASNVDSYVNICRQQTSRYDLHFYFPYGLLPFESDGYRSELLYFHERIDKCIRQLLAEWSVKVINLNMVDLEERYETVMKELRHWP